MRLINVTGNHHRTSIKFSDGNRINASRLELIVPE